MPKRLTKNNKCGVEYALCKLRPECKLAIHMIFRDEKSDRYAAKILDRTIVGLWGMISETIRGIAYSPEFTYIQKGIDDTHYKPSKNLKNKKFGLLKAKAPIKVRQNGKVVWRCICDCGETTFVTTGHLLSGNTRSCGCERAQNTQDLTNRRFGMLRAIRPTTERFHGNIVWRCKCDCGGWVNVPSTSLLTEHTRSCGCQNRQGGYNLTNRQFGRLKAVEPTPERKDGSIVWRCECECGNREVFVPAKLLLRESVKSCGCLKTRRTLGK